MQERPVPNPLTYTLNTPLRELCVLCGLILFLVSSIDGKHGCRAVQTVSSIVYHAILKAF